MPQFPGERLLRVDAIGEVALMVLGFVAPRLLVYGTLTVIAIFHTAPVSVALSRQMLWRMLGAAHPMEAHRVDSRFIARQGHGGDVTEGVNAFLEKRPPAFPNQVSTGLPPWPGGWTEPTYG